MTRKEYKRCINWLFFNPANDDSTIYPTVVPSRLFGTSVEKLEEWPTTLKTLFGSRVDADALRFWRPSPPLHSDVISEDWIETHPDIGDVALPCYRTFCINELFDESWEPDHVHFRLISVKEPRKDLDPTSAEEWKSPLHLMHLRFNEARKPIDVPPSIASTLSEYTRLQKDPDTAIYDGFFVRNNFQGPAVLTVAPPVQVFHPIFQEFLDKVDDTTFEPDEGIVSTISALMTATVEIRPPGSSAFANLEPLLGKLSESRISQSPLPGTYFEGDKVLKELGDHTAPLICVEYKNAIGEGESDPLTQAAYSVRESLVSTKFKHILKKCCCPSFLLAGAGPYLCILGVVFTDKFIVQRLTDIMWIGEATTCEDAHVFRLSQIFGALQLAVEDLGNYYDRVSKDPGILPLVYNQPHPRFFPHPTGFMVENGVRPQWTKFEYIDACSSLPTNVTFIAKVKSSDQKLVVKFVERYGVQAHQLLADAGMAPRLLYCGPLDGEINIGDEAGSHAQDTSEICGLYVGQIRMVIMEYIEGDAMSEERPVPENARTQIEEAIQRLHDAQLVFGDLRAPNIMVSGDKVFFIDFDWAGEEGKVRYPRNLSRRIRWPNAAEELEMKPILKEHDLFMLRQLDQLFIR